MLKSALRLCLFTLFAALSACGTTDSKLSQQGHNESYLQGFHDGRHTGMKEAGNNWEHYVKDHEKFDSDQEYRAGWLAGEAEGKRLQAQARAIGESMSGTYTGYQVGKEVDKNSPNPEKAAKKAMKGVDPAVLKTLEK